MLDARTNPVYSHFASKYPLAITPFGVELVFPIKCACATKVDCATELESANAPSILAVAYTLEEPAATD